MNRVCYLDLDGVLVDFVRGALAHFDRPDFLYRDVRWGIEKQLRIEPELFWSGLGFAFWANLPWGPEGKHLLALVEEIFGENVVLLTSPCDTPGAVEGKAAWIKREMPAYKRRFFIGPPKHLVAGPGKVLLDDHEDNVEAFAANGGHTVLAPRPWNRRRGETDEEGRFNPLDLAAELVLAGRDRSHK
jgi:5'(3')-deoxyribonucleotidase